MATKNYDIYINEILTKHLIQVSKNDKQSMKDSCSSWNAGIVERTVKNLIKELKVVSPMFKLLFKEIVKTGSHYNKLKVKEATEFDIDLVLTLPVEPKDIQLTIDEEHPNFVTVEIVDRAVQKKLKLRKEDKFEELPPSLIRLGGNLSRGCIQQWMHHIVGKALASNKFVKPPEITKINWDLHGPAFTMKLVTENDTISVDLVPVIDGRNLPLPDSVNCTLGRYQKLSKEDRIMVLVPKSRFGPSTQLAGSSDLWRIAFPKAEFQLIKGKGCVPVLIRLFKILRDNFHWDEVYSFMINAIFIEKLANRARPDCWKEENLGSLFMMMLKEFHTLFSSHEPFLPFYFIRKANLMKDFNHNVAFKVAEDLAKIMNKIEQDPENIGEFFDQPVKTLAEAAAKEE